MRKSTKAREFIDPYEFYLARKRAGLTVKAAADMLHVTERTVRNWENKTSQIPYAAFRLMRIQAGHVVNSSGWEGWTMSRGVLYSPIGRSFEPYTLTYLGNYLWMARRWLKEKRLANAAKTLTPSPKSRASLRPHASSSLAKPFEVEPLERDGASGATAPSGARPPHGDIRANLTVAGRQGKTLTFAKFGNASEFGTFGEASNEMLASEEM